MGEWRTGRWNFALSGGFFWVWRRGPRTCLQWSAAVAPGACAGAVLGHQIVYVHCMYYSYAYKRYVWL